MVCDRLEFLFGLVEPLAQRNQLGLDHRHLCGCGIGFGRAQGGDVILEPVGPALRLGQLSLQPQHLVSSTGEPRVPRRAHVLQSR